MGGATSTAAGNRAAPVACRPMGVGRVTGCAMEGFAWMAVLLERLLLTLVSMLPPPLLLSMLPPRLPPLLLSMLPPRLPPLLLSMLPPLCPGCCCGGAGICS